MCQSINKNLPYFCALVCMCVCVRAFVCVCACVCVCVCCFIFQYNLYPLKHVFPVGKQTLVFHQHLNRIFSHFLTLLSTLFSLENFVPSRGSLGKSNKKKTGREENLDPKEEFPRGVMVKAMDCEIVVSEFVFQLYYYVHFRTNTVGKCMNPLILPAMG